MSSLCVPITASTVEQMEADIRAASAAGAEMIELRLDYLADHSEPAIARLMAAARRFSGQVIATCRLAEEGGHWDGDETSRVSLLEAVGLAGVDFIDFEHAAWQRSANVRQKIGLVCAVDDRTDRTRGRLILSKHDFETTPEDLDAIFAELQSEPAHVVKLACKANRITDVVRMLDALRKSARTRLTIGLSMGEAGVITRVLAGKVGGLLTFASLEAGKESAPGQLTFEQMRSLYRWDALRPETRVYGVIGCPVAHSMSPAIMNGAFGATGYDGIYLPLRVEPAYEDFAAFVDGCLTRPWLDLHGCSVTIPHKQNLLRFVSERGGYIEPLAARIGAANTLVIEWCGTDVSPVSSGNRVAPSSSPRQHGSIGTLGAREEDTGETPMPHRLAAFNTDYRGAMDALLAGLAGTGRDLKDAQVAVLGAGGASRAIVAGLLDAGCDVNIYNRTAERARQLADEFGAVALPWEQRDAIDADVIINCTSIGMWPKVDESPLSAGPRSSRTLVFDTVYNPIETRLLQQAHDRGCATVDGVAMFVGQAAAQFQRWTGQPAPLDLIRNIMLERLQH